ncbi:MAG: DUF255 domain-containing protein [Pirellula sp.]|jgi:YHS domain-containing protein/thioredoxin-related protein
MLKSGIHSILVISGILFWLSQLSLAEETSIRWFDNFESGVRHATANQLPLMLHFYGESCPPCKMLEKRAYKDPHLVDKINKQMVAIKINGDRQKDLRHRYQITSWPTDVYLTPTGKELYRTTSPQDAAVYAQLVDRVALQCTDWNVEEMAARKSEERRIAKKTSTQLMQSGQSAIDPAMTGPVVHPVVTQSRVSGPSPAKNPPTANPNQRRIDNPHLADNPLVVPPAPNSPSQNTPATGFATVPSYPVHQQPAPSNGAIANPGLPVANRTVPVQPIAATRDVPSTVAEANGLEGFCPVTLVMAGRAKSSECWVEGKPEFAVKHRGRIYFCASEDARKTFLSAPDEFAPALSSYDLIHFVKTGQLIDGRCEFGSFQPTTGKVFLFANQENCVEFLQMESHYSELLHRGMSADRFAEQPNTSQRR